MDNLHRSADEREIDALFGELGAAHEARDAARIVACYTDDALIFDLAPPLSRRGMGEKQIADWLATWDGPILIDGIEMGTTVSGDLAVATGLCRMRGSIGGEAVEFWLRGTAVLRRTADGWRIVHDHSSVPFHMDGSFRAAVDLVPTDAEH